MALNSVVAKGGFEIGRAQAMQAAAAGLEPEVAMNPILIKPSGARQSQVIVMGKPYATVGARDYQELKDELKPIVAGALQDLRARYDVVVCEGAGSPAEINLRAADLTNMGLARAADLPVLLVGDIDRGGVFASLLGTVAALEPADQRHIAGFVINKFRGDDSILAPGLEQITGLTGRPVLGVLPFVENLTIDAEDSLAIERPHDSDGTLDVAVVRLRWMSNFTDLDALAREPGVRVRFTRSAVDVERADLVVLPGTKATVEDLQRLRDDGLDKRAGAAPGADPRHLRRLPDARRDDRRRRRVGRGHRRRPRAAAGDDDVRRGEGAGQRRAASALYWAMSPATRSATAAPNATAARSSSRARAASPGGVIGTSLARPPRERRGPPRRSCAGSSRTSRRRYGQLRRRAREASSTRWGT